MGIGVRVRCAFVVIVDEAWIGLDREGSDGNIGCDLWRRQLRFINNNFGTRQ